ncbi:SMC family ATPase [Dermabacteraceae bacterium TAE3-ERU5]|nr:SMC family ATPase [Dermabacteraceae bacterium TAE3-ERU5]
MRLHRLKLRGIGPFREEFEIDFSRLGASGLFLLEGPTGSGKSTVLDAIVFALYGDVAGEARGKGRIRSQYSRPSEPSMVDLVFETGSGIYRVWRSPEYQRPKQRGEGFTKEQAKAKLWRITSPDAIAAVMADDSRAFGGIEPVATRIDEVGREITAAVGLNREQFSQTVVLPQGEFARFLRAKTDERRAVLQKIFATEIYERIEDQLAQDRRGVEREREEALTKLRAALGSLCDAARLDEEKAAELEESLGSDEVTRELCAQVLTDLTEKRDTAAEQLQAADERRAASEKARDTARQASALAQQKAQLDGLEKRLSEGREENTRLRELLATDERTNAAAPALREETQAGEALRGAQGDLRAAWERAERDGEAPTHADDALAARLESEADAASRAAGALEAALRLEAGLDEREKAIAAEETRLEEQRELLEKDAATLKQRPEEEKSLRERLAAQENLARGENEARERLAAAELVKTAAEEAQQLAKQVQAAESALEELAKHASAAVTEEARLRRARIAAVAFDLAENLNDGEPCPVCGSAEHPQPAQSDGPKPSDADVEAAEETRAAAETDFNNARTALAGDTERLRGLREKSQQLTPQQAAEAVAERKTRLAQAKKAAAEKRELEKTLADYADETLRLDKALQEGRVNLAAAKSALAEKKTALAADQKTCAEGKAEYPSVKARVEALRVQERYCRELSGLMRGLGSAEKQLARRRETLAATLAENGFANAQAARQAQLSAQQRDAYRENVARYDSDAQRLAVGLEAPGVAEADGSAENLRRLGEALAEKSAALEEANACAGTARSAAALAQDTLTRAETARQRLEDALREGAAVRERADLIYRVAQLATGNDKTAGAVRLSTFVLMRRFDDVLGAANSHLSKMSQGQFEIARSAGSGRGKTGLDVEVIDALTGRARPADTLSGGETFYVSLSLALGLADVVTAEAGGIELGTLFIDEGFGSLDGERLDTVMSDLLSLSSHGRTVGLVSHVEELKRSIPDRIRVRRGRDGASTLEVVA